MRGPATFSSRLGLRIAAAAFLFAGLVLLSGCWVSSINPLYEESLFSKADPDIILDQNLVGAWWFKDEDCPGTLTIAANGNAYDFTMTPSPQCKHQEKTHKYEGHLVKLDNHLFMDLTQDQEEICDLCLPLHDLFQAKIEKDSLALTPIDYDWLKNSIEKKTLTIQTLPDRPQVLTASSKELKEFMRKYADDKSAFKPSVEFTFKKK